MYAKTINFNVVIDNLDYSRINFLLIDSLIIYFIVI